MSVDPSNRFHGKSDSVYTDFVLSKESVDAFELFKEREDILVSIYGKPDKPTFPGTFLTPYLGLNAKLSRSHANQAVLALVLVICTLFIMSESAVRQGEIAKRQLVSSCTGLEIAVNSIANMPRLTAVAINHQTAASIRGIIDHTARFAGFTVELLKHLILYVLFRYQRIILCVLQMGVSTATGAISAHAQEITDFVNHQLGDIGNVVTGALQGFNEQLNHINDLSDKIDHVKNSIPFGAGNGIPNIPHIGPLDIPGLSDKLHLSLPQDFSQRLSSLGSRVPTLDDIEKKVSDLLSGPFDSLASKLKSALQHVKTPNTDLLPVPQATSAIRFCDPDKFKLVWIDRVVEGTVVGIWYGCLLLIFFILVIIAFQMIIITTEHRLQEKNLGRLRALFTSIPTVSGNMLVCEPGKYVPIESSMKQLVAAAQFPLWFALHDRIAKCIFKSPSNHIRSLWLFNYLSHPFTLLCIIFGVVGLIAVRLQLVIFETVVAFVVPFIAKEVELAVEQIMDIVGNALGLVVKPYVEAVNHEIDTIEGAVNKILFGWVGETLHIVEGAVDHVFGGFSDAINNVFKDVPVVRDAVHSFTTCVLGNHTKTLVALQSALEKGVGVSFGHVNESSMGIDKTKLMEALNITNTMMNLTSSAASAPEMLFQEQILWVKAEYERTMWLQMIPFGVALAMGLSVILIGILCFIGDACLSTCAKGYVRKPKMLYARH